MAKLTKGFLDGLEARKTPYFVWCSELPGFGARVFPNGRKTFYVDYYNSDGQRKRMSIGPFGKLTVDEARKLARINLGNALAGEDPATERKTRRGSITMSELCDRYVEAADKGLIIGRSGQPKKPSTLYSDKGRIDQHIKPLLGRKLVIDLKTSDIAKFIRDVTVGKTAKIEKSDKLRGRIIVEGGAGTASRTTGLLGGILSFAVSEGIIDRNPVHGVKRPTDKKKRRRLTADEYKAIGKALSETTQAWQAVAFAKLLLLTGCRRGEIEKLKWSEVDLDGSALHLGDTKTGASVRPIGSPVVDLLKSLPRKDKAVYVLPGVHNEDQPYGGFPAALKRLLAAVKLEDVSAHTFRHSFASVAADLDYSDATIGALLGHAGTTITSRYTHRLDSVLIAVADKVAEEVSRQMGL